MKSKVLQKAMSLLLPAVLVALFTVSCAGGDDGTKTTDEAGSESATTAPPIAEGTEVESAAYDYLPNKSYSGDEFNIVTPDSGTRYLPGQILTTEVTGDIIMDAAYIRNRNVEDKFHVTITHTPITAANFYTSLKQACLPGMMHMT